MALCVLIAVYCTHFQSQAIASREAAAHLTLSEALQRAHQNSNYIKSAEKSFEAAEHKADAQFGSYFPKLSLEANYHYLTEVPTIQLGATSFSFGDNENYSYGPVLSYTLWDGGTRTDLHRSLSQFVEAQKEQKQGVRLSVSLETEVAYVQAQLFQSVLAFSQRSAELSREQLKDISHRHASGSVSKIDSLSAQMDVSNYELHVANHKGNFQAALVKLISLTGPILNSSQVSADREGVDSLNIQLDQLLSSADRVAQKKISAFSESHPHVEAQRHLSQSLEFASNAEAGQYWPHIQLQAKSSVDYPNGPILREVHQNVVMVNLNWTLWDWASTRHRVGEKRAAAFAAEFQANDQEVKMERDYQQAVVQLKSLREQRERAKEIAIQAERLAKLNYASYRAGGLAYLQVQTANLKLMEARIRRAQIEAQFLTQYYQLQFFAGKKETM